MNSMMNTTNNILAIVAASPAIPQKPRYAATRATIKKNIAQPSIIPPPGRMILDRSSYYI